MIQRVPRHLREKAGNSQVMARIGAAILEAEFEVDQDKEHFWVIGLNTKLRIAYVELVTLGTLDASLVHPREVFRTAVARGVSAIALMHNHPSGDPEPSREDIRVTELIEAAGNVLGIQVIDHVIVGNESGLYASKSEGWRTTSLPEGVAETAERYRTGHLF